MRIVPTLISAITCYTGMVLVGFEGGYVSPTAQSLIQQTAITQFTLPIFAATIYAGSVITLPLLTFVSKYFNVKTLLIFSTLPGCLGWLTAVIANDLYSMLVGRFLLGVQTSVLFLTSVYMGEIATPNTRRFYCSGISLSMRSGLVLIYVIGIWVSFRWLAVTAIFLEVAFLLLMLVNPTPPSWLVDQGLEDRAFDILTYLRGDEDIVDKEIADMKNGRIIGITLKEKLSQLTRWSVIKPIIIVTTINNFKPLSGLPSIVAFSSQILSEQQGLPPNIAALFFPITLLVGNIIGQQLVSRFNLKRILITTTSILVGSHLSMSIYFGVVEHILHCSSNEHYSLCYQLSFWPILNIAVYGVSFGSGMDSVVYALLGEAFEANNREVSVCIVHAMGSILCVIVIVLFYYVLVEVGGMAIYGIFFLVLSIAIPLECFLID